MDKVNIQEQEDRQLTPRQAEVFGFLISYWREHGHVPTFREIAAGVGLGPSSYSAVNAHMAALRRKGYISKGRPHKRMGWHILCGVEVTRNARGIRVLLPARELTAVEARLLAEQLLKLSQE